MSKYTKRISKHVKSPKNALVLGSAFGSLDGYIEAFSTAFIFSKSDNRIKNKKLVYRESTESILQITDVDFIFIDTDYFEEIKNLSPVLRKYKPVVLLQGSEFKNKHIKKLFNSEGYDIVEIDKHYSTWKPK
jgi:hypothetical protein